MLTGYSTALNRATYLRARDYRPARWSACSKRRLWWSADHPVDRQPALHDGVFETDLLALPSPDSKAHNS